MGNARELLEPLYDYLVGSHSSRLTDDQAYSVYVLCDGFGPADLTGDWLREYFDGGCDWSHVRDSSDAAILAAAAQLQRVVAAS